MRVENGEPGHKPLESLAARRAEVTHVPPKETLEGRLSVTVVYTTHAATLAAVKTASRLGGNLATRLKILWLYAVPYTLPLEEPAAAEGFLMQEIRALARESPIEIAAQVYLCREPRRSLHQILPPHSLVVLGGKKRWWPTKEQRLARSLRKDGHEVILVDPE
jgi:hypothetical protein